MTVTNTNLRNDYTGNGATTVYAFTFVAIYEVGSAKYSLKVITTDTDGVETLKTQGTDYTVALASNGTGTITFATAPTSGHKISILPDMTLTQETDYIKSGSDKFPAESHEKALDKLTLIAKQFSELFKRTIKLPNNSLLSEITIPIQTSNANKAIVVNSSGNGLDTQSLIDIGTYPITAFAETLLDDTNASQARQTLGLVIGTNVQAYNANLQALAGLVGAANKIPYFTGVGAMGLGDLLQIATQAEVNAGTDTQKAIVPSTFAASKFNSSNLISSQTAAGAASIVFTGLSSAYSVYEFEFINVYPSLNGVGLVMQFSTDNGSTWQNTNYLSDGIVDTTANPANESQNNARGPNLSLGDSFPNNNVSNNAALGGLTGWAKVYNPSSSVFKLFHYRTVNIMSSDGTTLSNAQGYGIWKNTTPVNAVRFIFKTANSDTNNGNISGTIKMRGYI